ncbi:MAG: ComF family protein [Clostridiales bacterium]|nr:ComF family protein [Clostridiales bacterium]MDY2833810.1 ComF family protein [Candidatus Aphodomonas sp.]
MKGRIFAALLALLHPRGACCVACGALHTADGLLCERCQEELNKPLPPRCPGCGRKGWAALCPECSATLPAGYLPFFAPFDYSGAAKALVRRLKYDCVLDAALPLGRAMAAALPAEPFDALVPVPLNAKRERERGFNQSRALCEVVSAHTGVPVLDALVRTRYTKTQTHLSASEREANVRSVFECAAGVRGMRIILVDDVRTTGATAKSCASVLLASGAERVILLAAASAHPVAS